MRASSSNRAATALTSRAARALRNASTTPTAGDDAPSARANQGTSEQNTSGIAAIAAVALYERGNNVDRDCASLVRRAQPTPRRGDRNRWYPSLRAGAPQ